ncbi:MAG: tetratricopeptide repeat protein [Candidatus Eisenbacteria bacterium]
MERGDFRNVAGAAVAAAAVAAVVLAGYLHTLHYPFQFDDFYSIRDNPVLRPPLDAGEIWRFRPGRSIPMFSFAAQVAWFGPSVAALRAVNLLLHALAALLVGWVAAELCRRARDRRPCVTPAPEAVGLIAALLFAAHPLATQSVTYVVQRITTLGALFELMAVAAFLRARRGDGEGWWWASWSSTLLAALTKEMAVALPALLILVEWVLRQAGAKGRSQALRFLPYFAIVPLVAALAAEPFGPEARRAEGLRDTPFVSRGDYARAQLTVIPRYLSLAVWPANQQLDPHVVPRPRVDAAVLGGALVIVVMAGLAWWSRRRAPVAAIGLGWFLIAVAPESSVIPIRNFMMEHRAYVPLAGLAWAAAAACGWLVAHQRVWILVPLAAILALTTVTHFRNRAWRSEGALWADNARKSPLSPTAQTNLGLALQDEGRPAEAEAAFRAALLADPGMVLALSNLGRLYGQQRRLDEARKVLEQAEGLEPGHPDVLNNLGTLYWMQGDTARAAARFQRAIAADPGSPWPANNLTRMRAGVPPPDH